MPPPLSLVHHDGEVSRTGLGRADQQAGGVVDEGQIARSAMVRWPYARAAPIAVDTVPSIPAAPRLDRTATRWHSARPARRRAPGSMRPAPAGRPA